MSEELKQRIGTLLVNNAHITAKKACDLAEVIESMIEVERAASPSPASDAELQADLARVADALEGCEAGDRAAFARIRAASTRTASELPKLDDDDEVVFPNDTGLAVIHVERYYELRGFEEACTASDTRTAAGEAECDAALHAAPASQHADPELIIDAVTNLVGTRNFDEVSASELVGAFRKALAAEQPSTAVCCALESIPAVLFDGHAVYREVMANDPNTPRPTADNIANVLDAVVRLIRRTASTDAAAGPACQGGNTKQDALQELTSIAQANNMGYGPPAVDVGAERKLFEAWAVGPEGEWMPHALARDHKNEYRELEVRAQWTGWLAARTQADAGKAGAGAQIAEGE